MSVEGTFCSVVNNKYGTWNLHGLEQKKSSVINRSEIITLSTPNNVLEEKQNSFEPHVVVSFNGSICIAMIEFTNAGDC